MKKIVTTLAISLLVAGLAMAGDDQIQSVAYTTTQTCTSALRPKTWYAIQCTSDCYVRMQEANSADAGQSVNTGSVKVPAGKLYDTPTTYNQTFICVVQSTASGTMNVFRHRGPTE